MSDQHSLNGPTQGPRQSRPSAKAHDQVRALTREPDGSGELRSNRCHFDRLVEERIAYAERRGLQREAFVAASHFDPVRLVGGLADEHGDAGRTAGSVAIAR